MCKNKLIFLFIILYGALIEPIAVNRRNWKEWGWGEERDHSLYLVEPNRQTITPCSGSLSVYKTCIQENFFFCFSNVFKIKM